MHQSAASRLAAMYRPTLALVVVATLAFLACSSDDDDNPNEPAPPPESSAYIGGVSVGGTDATYHSETIPTGTAGAPGVVGAGQIVSGGSLVLEVSVEDNAEALYVAVEGASGGYYEVDLTGGGGGVAPLPAHVIAARKGLTVTRTPQAAPGLGRAAVTYNVTVTSAGSTGPTNFTLQVGASYGDSVSAVAPHPIAVNTVAQLSDTLQVSLNWTQPVDLDLHVEVPGGTVIFYGNRVGPNGGQLDLDSNPACVIDNINNENITWNETMPAAGSYSVRVNLWAACDLPGPFPYAVTLRIGDDVQVFESAVTAAAEDPGGEGTLITQFTL
ncbi:MAG: hypothetical protein PVF43_11930 [Candidatus Eiseniibacteriota bacterium]|jgi:hypothetical protein